MKKTDLLLPIFVLVSLAAQAQWSPFCTGQTNGFIVEFDTHEDELYATGFFTRIGGRNARYLARWSSVLGLWQQVGSIGLPEAGHAMHSFGDALYVAAYHFATDSNYVFRWNNDNGFLSVLGDGFLLSSATGTAPYVPSLYDITDFNDRLVVCGEFNRIGTQVISGIAAWDGMHWIPLGTGLGGSIEGGFNVMAPHKLLAYGGSLYVVGNFRTAGNLEVNGVARWTGQEWQAMGDGFNGSVYGIEFYEGDIYVGGSFTQSGTTALANVARWNGSSWESPGISVDYVGSAEPFVHTLKAIDDKLYLLGGFDACTDAQGNTIPCGSILEYDGTAWNGLQGGLVGEAEAIVPYNGALLIGGQFSSAGGIPVNSMALWGSVTGTHNLPQASLAVSVAPNPLTDHFTVTLPTYVGSFDYWLYSVDGKLVRAGSAMFGEQIQVPHLPKGYYTLQGSCEKGNFQHKIIVQ